MSARAGEDGQRDAREDALSGPRAPHIAVIGASDSEPPLLTAAEEVGRRLAHAGAIVVCGGLGGVMEAVCRGAKAEGGSTLGLLPGADRDTANPHVDIVVPTGLGEARNALVVRSGEAVVAVGGAYGTLAEIGFALKMGIPVVGLDTWELARGGRSTEAIERAASAEQAAGRALELALAGHCR